MTGTPLPGSLQEYLMVWCGDLLAGLDAASPAHRWCGTPCASTVGVHGRPEGVCSVTWNG